MRVLILAAAAVLAAGAAQAQPANCKMYGNLPAMVTGTGQASSTGGAMMSAQSNWSQMALPFGSAYANWSKAQQKSSNCVQVPSGPFGKAQKCTVRAQPCK